jgi:hypothetical protein
MKKAQANRILSKHDSIVASLKLYSIVASLKFKFLVKCLQKEENQKNNP